MGTVRFGNDHFAAIIGYGDYVQGNLTICHVYYVEGLGHNLFSVGQFCKSKKASLPSKLVPSTESKLELLHMDLCGPIRVTSINGKKYILVIVDDYSRFTWVYFLRTKDEAPNMIIDFVNQVQRNLKASILMIQTDNGTEFKNKKLRYEYCKNLKKMVKTGQTRTWERKSTQRTGKIDSKKLKYLGYLDFELMDDEVTMEDPIGLY
ncbi:integrase, catalytic region, zinc finger, CCHC-type containing protein [Tanacetum coccineum]|uniref:Integrase, catalytic region, zinc finger, CCHC-type containing protein n=1 Tax=Tanacetum coccineum TaxID=301880 RepID=A0ABQ5GBL5_9ASTR